MKPYITVHGVNQLPMNEKHEDQEQISEISGNKIEVYFHGLGAVENYEYRRRIQNLAALNCKNLISKRKSDHYKKFKSQTGKIFLQYR